MQKFYKWELYLTVLVVLQMPRRIPLYNPIPHHYKYRSGISSSCLKYLMYTVKLSPAASREISRKIHVNEDNLLQMTDQEIRDDVYNNLPTETVNYKVTEDDLEQLFAVLAIDRQALEDQQHEAIALQKRIKYVAGVHAELRKAAPGAELGRIHRLSQKLNLNLYEFTRITYTQLEEKLKSLDVQQDDKALVRKAWQSRLQDVPERKRTFNRFQVKCHTTNAYFV